MPVGGCVLRCLLGAGLLLHQPRRSLTEGSRRLKGKSAIILSGLAVAISVSADARACPACKTGPPSRVHVEPSPSDTEKQPVDNGSFLNAGDFHLDLTVEYRKWDVIDPLEAVLLDRQGRHVHNFSQEWFYHVSLAFGATDDLELSVSVPFRDLRSVFIDDERPALIGSHDSDSSGLGDVEVGARWRLMRDPFELYLIADVGIPTGDTHNRDRLGRRFEPEFQPGSGGWSTTLGMGVAKQRGPWSAHFEAHHTLRFKGERDYEFGDSTQLRLGGSYQLPLRKDWPALILLGDVIAQFNEPDVDRGVTLGGHRAKLLFLVPGIAIQPSPNLTFTVTAPIPVYQDWTFHQEIDYSIRFSIGFSF